MNNLSKTQRRYLALLAGVAVFLFFYFVNPFGVKDVNEKGERLNAVIVLAIAALMITWWVTEALPMPVVALLPIILFPLFGISDVAKTTVSYSNDVIFLFMGGFMLGLAIEKWNLHRRIALSIVKMTGTSGDRIILGFILATGLLSMWLSNTATTMMMFPIALSVIHVMKENDNGEGNIANFSLVLMLVIAFASNMSIGTIIGTPPNVSYVNTVKAIYNHEISFIDWMILCTPLSIVLLLALYLVLAKWLYPNRIKANLAAKTHIQEELKMLGPLSRAEKRVLAIFIVTAVFWMARDVINLQPYFKIDDTIIALLCTVALFIVPSGLKDEEGKPTGNALLEWSDTQKMAWGILLLFGGGIALAAALKDAQLIQNLGSWLAQFSGNGFMLVLMVTFISLFLSEVMSNVAQVIVFAPVVSGLADAIGMNPLLLGIPMTLGASCASMLPMGTPPNAIVFSSGYIRLKQMSRAGFVMNIISVILIAVFCWFLIPVLMPFKR